MKLEFIQSCLKIMIACFIVLTAITVVGADEDASPIFGVRMPPEYRQWQLISVAHEAGSLNDIRAILGNDIAVEAYRAGTRPFPEGAMIARLAWAYVASEENNAIFGQAQSFVPGAPTNIQVSVKDAKRYPETGGWGYGQFENGRSNRSETLIKTCAPCHAHAPQGNDFVFTRYAP